MSDIEGLPVIRARAPVERFDGTFFDSEKKSSEKKGVAYRNDSKKLGDIESIATALKKTKANDASLQVLHKVIYGRAGVENKRRRALLQFSGFLFQDDSEKQSVLAKLERSEKTVLSKIAKIVHIPVSGNKQELCERLLVFLENPSASELGGRGLKPKKRSAKKLASKKIDKASSRSNIVTESDHEEEDVSESESAQESDGYNEKPAKKPKTASKASKKPSVKSSEIVQSSSDEENDEGVGQPLDENLVTEIRNLIKNSKDIHSLSVKTIRNKLELQFKTDLKSKKAFITDTAMSILSEMNLV